MPEQRCAKCGGALEDGADGGRTCPNCDERVSVLAYSTPAVEAEAKSPPVPPADAWCLTAFFCSPLSAISPIVATLIAAAAGYGIYRAKHWQYRGIPVAIVALVICALSPIFLPQMLREMKVSSISVQCMSNLRAIGQGIMIYENDYPDATGYAIEDMMALVMMPNSAIECPLEQAEAAAAQRTPATSYILLSHLQPFRQLPQSASVVIGYCMHRHSVGNRPDKPASIPLLYADGHVERVDLPDARKQIQASLMMKPPTTRPTSRPR